MSPSPYEAIRAARGEVKPCAVCGRPKWFHSQALAERRFQDFRDDGHTFRISLAFQAKLPFGEHYAVKQNAIQTQHKKPPHHQAMQKAGQKKPLQRQAEQGSARKTGKPGKRSVA
jgi:hypothetical protein